MGPLTPKPIVHFEIQVTDIERAVAFYTQVFGWIIKKNGEQWPIHTGRSEYPAGERIGIDGNFTLRERTDDTSDHSGIHAFVCIISVHNIQDYLDSITNSGGEVIMPLQAISGVGWKAYCRDTEDNIFGIMQNDSYAR